MTDELIHFFHGLSSDPAARFAEVFLAGDAAGVQPVTRQAFLAALPARAACFAQTGLSEPVLAALTHETLDEDGRSLLARTEWDAGGARLASSYLLHRADDGTLRVVVYLNHKGFA